MLVVRKWNGMSSSEIMTTVVRSVHQGCYEPQDTNLVNCSTWKSMISGNRFGHSDAHITTFTV